MILRRAFSKSSHYFESVCETLPDGSVIAKPKGVFFNLSRDMDHDYIRYRMFIERAKSHSDEEICLHFDGASKNNPGEAGCGFVFSTLSGEELAGFAVNLYICTNNVAEYSGLTYGLFTARLAGLKRLAIFGDSNLIVKQFNNQWGVKDATLYTYYDAVTLTYKGKKLAKQLEKCTIEYIPRNLNKRADKLSNDAVIKRPVASDRVRAILREKKAKDDHSDSKKAVGTDADPNSKPEPQVN